MYKIHKAPMLKRVSAFLLDFILFTIAVTGFAFLFSLIMGTSKQFDTIAEREHYYETKYYEAYGITEAEYEALSEEQKAEYNYDFSVIGTKEFDEMTEAERAAIEAAYMLCQNDETYRYANDLLIYLLLTIVTLSLLLSFILLEIVIPQILGNGQTVGKKIFAVGVIHVNAVKLSGVGNFTRVILGKFTVETMIPLTMLILLLGTYNLTGLIVIALFIILELFAFFKNKLYTPVHDVLAHTVCVDMSVQLIYESEAALIRHKEKLHAEVVQDSDC